MGSLYTKEPFLSRFLDFIKVKSAKIEHKTSGASPRPTDKTIVLFCELNFD